MFLETSGVGNRCYRHLCLLILALFAELALLSGCVGIFNHETRRLTSPDGQIDAVWLYRPGGALGKPFEGLFLTPPGTRATDGQLIYKVEKMEALDFRWVDKRAIELRFAGSREIIPPLRIIKTSFAGEVRVQARAINSPELLRSPVASVRTAVILDLEFDEPFRALLSNRHLEVGDNTVSLAVQGALLSFTVVALDVENARVSLFYRPEIVPYKAEDGSLRVERETPLPLRLESVTINSSAIETVHFVAVNNEHLDKGWEDTFFPVAVDEWTTVRISYGLNPFTLESTTYCLVFHFSIGEAPAEVRLHFVNQPAIGGGDSGAEQSG